jgi:hypothetical protein
MVVEGFKYMCMQMILWPVTASPWILTKSAYTLPIWSFMRMWYADGGAAPRGCWEEVASVLQVGELWQVVDKFHMAESFGRASQGRRRDVMQSLGRLASSVRCQLWPPIFRNIQELFMTFPWADNHAMPNFSVALLCFTVALLCVLPAD